ncbi:MAG: hypothetical protein A4E47_01334 [Methanosaeta sp. PtaU1.Bin028]|nr:MAG: hypothetical protein A4E47_01334 [Methanosaeta sp. PtaU1.Bin028]
MSEKTIVSELINSDERLREQAPRIVEAREEAGLEGLVGGLQAVIINTEPDRWHAAAEELLRFTGLSLSDAFVSKGFRTCVFKTPGQGQFRSADIILRCRTYGENPFLIQGPATRTADRPNTRLETFVFETPDLSEYVSIQRSRGLSFMTSEPVRTEAYSFIQTLPSAYTGNSLGIIQWHDEPGCYGDGAEPIDLGLLKPNSSYLENIRWLDHAATRVKAQDRDLAILEFMQLTNYRFDFAVYVESLNSITSVARLSPRDFAMVFTSGIRPYDGGQQSGPTEMFIRNYGTRVHHLAFQTEAIEETFAGLKEGGLKFLIGLVGSPQEGLKQTFSQPSPSTLLVNEYIHRYGGFDGFFTKSNVTLLTASTARQ